MTTIEIDHLADRLVAERADDVASDSAKTWVSVDPHSASESRTTATTWNVFLNRRDGSERTCLWSSVLSSTGKGWAALAELDDVLWQMGYMRCQDWQIGSGRGYVAWVAPMTEGRP